MRTTRQKVLVLGASEKPWRYANLAMKRLSTAGYEVRGIGKTRGQIEGLRIEDKKIQWKNVHTISIYLRAELQGEYYAYIISLNPARIIFNPGTENPAFESVLTKEGISWLRACTLVMLQTGQF